MSTNLPTVRYYPTFADYMRAGRHRIKMMNLWTMYGTGLHENILWGQQNALYAEAARTIFKASPIAERWRVCEGGTSTI